MRKVEVQVEVSCSLGSAVQRPEMADSRQRNGSGKVERGEQGTVLRSQEKALKSTKEEK